MIALRSLPGCYVCVAVRYDSSRLKGKAFCKLTEDHEVLHFLIERLAGTIDRKKIIICTTSEPSDDRIEELAIRLGVRVFRGDTLDVMKRFLDATAHLDDCHHIIRVTGDNPLTDPSFIIKMAAYQSKESLDYTYTRQIPRGTRAEIISRNYLAHLHKIIPDRLNTEYMTYYLLQDVGQRMVGYRDKSLPNLDCHNLTIDTYEDLNYMRNLLKNFKNPHLTSLEDIVDFIKAKGMRREDTKEDIDLVIPSNFIIKSEESGSD